MPGPAPSGFPQYPLEDYLHHRDAIEAAVARALAAGNYILGDQVAAFEQEFAAFTGAAHAVGVANGTDAIELILRALDIGNGDFVALPSLTAVASAAGIERAGARPVFVDIDPVSYTICPDALTALLDSPIGRSVKAVLAVHLYGHPVNWPALAAIASAAGIPLLEDCAQAHGASHAQRPTGSLGIAAAFSFYPTKNLGAIGDGGAITTSDAALAATLRELRQYGWHDRYISRIPGVNSRLDELQAAILRAKLPGLHAAIDRRRILASHYHHLLGDLPDLTLPTELPDCRHAYHLHVVRHPRRDALLRHLLASGIPAAIHYPAAIHQQPAYAAAAAISPPLPHTEEAVRTILSLPLHPYLEESALAKVAATMRSFA